MARLKTASRRAEFVFQITYFNPSGAIYFKTTDTWEVPVDELGGPIMRYALSKLRGLRNSGGQMGMPGCLDEGWPGPILLECGAAPAQLLLPSHYQTDLERLTTTLDTLGISYDQEEREQRVIVQRLPEREGLARAIITIDSGVGVGLEANTTFYFDRNGEFLSYATYEEA